MFQIRGARKFLGNADSLQAAENVQVRGASKMAGRGV